MKVWTALLLCMGIGASCVWISGGDSADPSESVTLFLSGHEAGTLKPCGCSSGQLGGLERRAALLDEVPAARRFVVSTGSLVETDSEQDQIKLDKQEHPDR